jgi:hypothetical protein
MQPDKAEWYVPAEGAGRCSKCGTWAHRASRAEHERTCWPSPAVSARQDAGAGFDPGGHWVDLVNRVVRGCTIHPTDHSRGVGEVRRELNADASDALEALVRMGPVTYMGPPVRAGDFDIGEPRFPSNWAASKDYRDGYSRGWKHARNRYAEMARGKAQEAERV